ncbi:class II fructose-bisphosphate aldolase [Streptomyces sp. NPDC054864]
MSLVSTADLVAQAAAEGRAVTAFNVVTLEYAEAIITGAETAERPVILQISENAVRYHASQVAPLARASLELARLSGSDVALHLDHVTDLALLRQAGDSGFSSVMFDAGALPFAENVEATAAAAQWAHAAGLWLEAELGYVGGKPSAPASAHAAGVRTDPDEATDFVRRTGVDALAVAVGSSHAMTERSASLDHGLIERLHEAISVPLVLHGSSGVPDKDLWKAVRAGITKINVGTALNVSFTAEVRRALRDDPAMTDPRRYFAPAREAMAATVRDLLWAQSA